MDGFLQILIDRQHALKVLGIAVERVEILVHERQTHSHGDRCQAQTFQPGEFLLYILLPRGLQKLQARIAICEQQVAAHQGAGGLGGALGRNQGSESRDVAFDRLIKAGVVAWHVIWHRVASHLWQGVTRHNEQDQQRFHMLVQNPLR